MMNAADASIVPALAGDSELGISTSGALRKLTLDRPQARNALNSAMRGKLAAAIRQIARDTNTYAVLLKSAVPGLFCAGGDVRELAVLAASDIGLARASLAAEYELIWLLECFSKPIVSLMDGPVMGAGAGITLVNTHRVAGPGYAFSMPEVRIGYLPDDGVAAVLGRLPGATGLYLGLTGRAIGRSDAFALGLVTHCISNSHFAHIEAKLAEAVTVDPLLDGLHDLSEPCLLEDVLPLIERCFSAETLEEIVSRLTGLRNEAPDFADAAWASGVLDDLAKASPRALKAAMRHIRNAGALDLRQTLTIDYRVGRRLLAEPDFREGVRSVVIDKDRRPRWRPTSLSDVTPQQIDDLFHADPGAELVLPTREEMQAARV